MVLKLMGFVIKRSFENEWLQIHLNKALKFSIFKLVHNANGVNFTLTATQLHVIGSVCCQGDVDYKPIISAEPDLATIDLEGDEDYLILACDGLWDTISYDEAVTETYNYLKLSTGSKANLAAYLADRAKEKGSTDNITVAVLFLREEIAQPRLDDVIAPLVAQEDDQVSGSHRGDGDSVHGSSDGGASNQQHQQQQTQDGVDASGDSMTHLQLRHDAAFKRANDTKSWNVLRRQQINYRPKARKHGATALLDPGRVVEYKYHPKRRNSDSTSVASREQADDVRQRKSPTIPEHFVKAFEFARKFPTRTEQVSVSSRSTDDDAQLLKHLPHLSRDEQGSGSPNVPSVHLTLPDVISAGGVASEQVTATTAGHLSSTDLRLVTQTGEECVQSRRSKTRRQKRHTVCSVSDYIARRPSRESCSVGIAERTQLSSGDSSLSPFSSGAVLATGSLELNLKGQYSYKAITGSGSSWRQEQQLTLSDMLPACKSNWTVAVEIENAASMFAD